MLFNLIKSFFLYQIKIRDIAFYMVCLVSFSDKNPRSSQTQIMSCLPAVAASLYPEMMSFKTVRALAVLPSNAKRFGYCSLIGGWAAAICLLPLTPLTGCLWAQSTLHFWRGGSGIWILPPARVGCNRLGVVAQLGCQVLPHMLVCVMVWVKYPAMCHFLSLYEECFHV